MLERQPNDQTLLDKRKKQNLCVISIFSTKNQTENSGRAMFLDEVKRSNILTDKQISHVYQTMFDRSAMTLDRNESFMLSYQPTRQITDLIKGQFHSL